MQTIHLQQQQQQGHQLFQDDEIELMTANLLKIKREITERNEHTHMDSPVMERQSFEQLKNKSMNATRTTQLSQEIKQKYQEYLISTKLPTNHEQKLEYLLESSQMNIGTAVSLFQMLYYFRDVISDEVLQQICMKAFQRIRKVGTKLSPCQKCCLFELIAICGVYNEEIISYVVEEMLEMRMDFSLSFVLFSNMGYKGIELLVNLAKEDFKETPMLILDYLSRTEQIIKQLLIPTFIEDLSSCKNKGREKDIILSILNRLNEIVSSNQQIFPLLAEMMHSNINDRGFIASVLRSCGIEGEKILLQFMNQYPNNEKIMLPIVSVLPWRAPTEIVLRIKVIQYTLGSNFLPGTLYQYEGNIEPSAFCFDQEDCCDSLCINARDFIAALNRMLTNKLQNFQNEQIIRKGPLNNLKLFTLYEVVGKRQEEPYIQISPQVIKALNKCISNPKSEIREAAINSLGLIGLPQAFVSIEQITKCLWDKDSRNRSMACWALSKICQNPSKKIISRLIQLLKDNFWKVRISACICIGAIVDQPHENVIESLVRCLKDNTINKVTVCETIIKLGMIGEEILLQILKNTNQNDFKLKQAVIYSLREADVKNPFIDFVLEEIFKHCKGTRIETRINCLETLNVLRVKASQEGEDIVYLKAKNILPFYYYFLEDPCLKIRQMATQSIFSFGGQAQLIFIEGIAKGSQMVRIQSAKGLARLGIQNFRALILGLRDQDAAVRKITTQVILSSFSPEDVASFYSEKIQQVPSLLCNLKDILSGGGLTLNMKSFIKQAILLLQKSNKYRSQGTNQLRKVSIKEGKSNYLYSEEDGQ